MNPRLSDRTVGTLALALLCALAAVILLPSLGAGALHVWDEGLYGLYAQNALRFDVWLHAVDQRGHFPTGEIKFSKPPLSIWVVALAVQGLGPSLFAFRLPFMLATFVVALVLFAWGRQFQPGTRGVWFGFAWGACWLVTYAVCRFGRTATIEPLLLAFVMLALYAHARELRSKHTRSALGWGLLTGLAILGAFLTKQVVCVLAVLPISFGALLRAHRERSVRPLLKILWPFGIALTGATLWAVLLYRKVGEAAASVLWQHAIVNRVSGFNGLRHRNTLNRIATLLDLDAAPLESALGLLGLVVLVASHWRNRSPARDDAILVSGSFITAWIAFDLGAGAILPWYDMTLLPMLTCGGAWLLVSSTDALASDTTSDTPPSSLTRLSAGAGVALAVSMIASASRPVLPSFLAVLVLSISIVFATGTWKRALWSWLAIATFSTLVVVGTLFREEYRRNETEMLAEAAVSLQGERAILLDGGLKPHLYTQVTYFGPDVRLGRAPWAKTSDSPGKKSGYRAFVAQLVAPSQLLAHDTAALSRLRGGFIVRGNVEQDPFPLTATEAALARGPLTFEAEHFESERYDTLRTQTDASGGMIRRFRPRYRERTPAFFLSKGRTTLLPPGKYSATFHLRVTCGGFPGESAGLASIALSSGRALVRAAIGCGQKLPPASDGFKRLIDTFTLPAAAQLDIRVQHKQGDLSIDRVTLARVLK